MARLISIKAEYMPLLGMAFSLMYWIADSAIDTYVFHLHHHFIESLILPDNLAVWSRMQVISLLMLFSLIATILLRRQIHSTQQLDRYRNELELIVQDRTADLIAKNRQLEVEIYERRKVEAELEYQATIDPLTSVLNRRKFNETLSYEIKRDERYSHNLSLIMCDLDKFKKINDEFGHDAGDQVLISFARLMSRTIRKSDVFARWGGEEFVILLPETDLEEAAQIASKLRLVTEANMTPQVGRITASFGVAEYHLDDSEGNLIKRADLALYKAKENGRNRVEVSYYNKSPKNLSIA